MKSMNMKILHLFSFLFKAKSPIKFAKLSLLNYT